MATKKKLLQAAAGTAAASGGAGGLNVEDVFSTYLYVGNGSSQTITNDIDVSGEGGLVWIKGRDTTDEHGLYDTERGAGVILQTNYTNQQYDTSGNDLTAFNSNGFSVNAASSWISANTNQNEYASWTFRKAPKFF